MQWLALLSLPAAAATEKCSNAKYSAQAAIHSINAKPCLQAHVRKSNSAKPINIYKMIWSLAKWSIICRECKGDTSRRRKPRPILLSKRYSLSHCHLAQTQQRCAMLAASLWGCASMSMTVVFSSRYINTKLYQCEVSGSAQHLGSCAWLELLYFALWLEGMSSLILHGCQNKPMSLWASLTVLHAAPVASRIDEQTLAAQNMQCHVNSSRDRLQLSTAQIIELEVVVVICSAEEPCHRPQMQSTIFAGSCGMQRPVNSACECLWCSRAQVIQLCPGCCMCPLPKHITDLDTNSSWYRVLWHAGMMGQAGIQAGVPVEVRQETPKNLSFQASP